MLYHKICVICGKNFQTNKFWQKACSRDCIAALNRINARNRYRRVFGKSSIPIQPKIHRCHVCGKQFIPSFNGEKHYSDKCRILSPAFLTAKFISLGG